MQGKYLFEYAVIRVVPRVEREEFVNAGVILYCKDRQFLQCMISLDEHRLCALCSETDIAELKEHLRSIEDICKGDKTAGPIAALDIASRFRWLTARRSTIVQTSQVHPGFSDDPLQTLTRLYNQLVL